MEQHIHEIAEELERKRLTSLRLNLSGFIFAGFTWMVESHLLKSGHLAVWVIIGLGAALWIGSLFNLAAIRRKINADKDLKQLFNDELSALQKLKTWKVGFIAVSVMLLVFFGLSFLVTIDAQLILQSTLFVGVVSVLGASIVLEEMLSIAVFQNDFDEEQYYVWNWTHWAFFHWILNPGGAFNELFLGQRVPKVLLVDKQSDKPLMERNCVPCPHCGKIHDARTWSTQNGTAFGHWYGYYCTNCGGIIPCLQNVTSYIILAITYPIRYPFLAAHKRRWMAKQPGRYDSIDITKTEHKKVNWDKVGLLFGGIMFVMMTFVFGAINYISDDIEGGYFEYVFDVRVLAINLVIWTLAGFGFGRIMKYLMGPKSPIFKSNSENLPL